MAPPGSAVLDHNVTDQGAPDPAVDDPAEPPVDTDADGEQEPSADGDEPAVPAHSGLFVGFLPADPELADIARTGGLPEDDLHCTLRYYGKNPDEQLLARVHETARELAAALRPFVVSVTGRRQLGDDQPPADVLVMQQCREFDLARQALPPSEYDYPAYLPHVTVGYGIGDDELAQSTPDNSVLFDHIVVGNGDDDWTPYMLGELPPPMELDDAVDGFSDVPMPPADGAPPEPVTAGVDRGVHELSVTAGIDEVIEGRVNAPGSRTKSRTVGKLDPRPGGSKQKCFHGSPITCKSVHWIAVYTALREKGKTKRVAAMIANAMHRRWREGRIGPRNHHPIIRKTI